MQWLSRRCAMTLLCCHRWSERAIPLPPLLVNVVWFYCHFLWWSHKPFPSPLAHDYLSCFQHPRPPERECRGADRPCLEMDCSCVAPGLSPPIGPLHKPLCCLLGLCSQPRGIQQSSLFHYSSYVFTEALPQSPLMRNFKIFVGTGLEALFNIRSGQLSSAILGYQGLSSEGETQ